MPPDLTAERYAVLFELLRQENLSEKTSSRLRARSFARAEIDREDAVMLRNAAMDSWG